MNSKIIENVVIYWKKSGFSKLIVIFLGLTLWPLTALVIWNWIKTLKEEWELPLKIVFVIFGIFISAAWLGAISGIMSGGRVGWGSGNGNNISRKASPPTLQVGNCIGPDGKRISLSTDECKKFNDAWKNPQKAKQDQPTQIVAPRLSDPYEILSQIGKEGAGDNSSVSVFDNDDDTIDVINNIVLRPEIEFGLDAYTRKWVTDFFVKTYASDLPIRYVLVTVAFTGTGRSAVRVGIGVNQAKNITKDEWKNTTPYDLCNWIKQVATGENKNDYANSTFAENYKCN